MNLSLANLLRFFARPSATQTSVRPPRKARLAVEHLENRLVPTTTYSLGVSVPSAAMAGNPIPVGVTAWFSETLPGIHGSTTIMGVDYGFTGAVTLKSSDNQMTPMTIQLVKGQEASPASIKLTKVDTLQIEASGDSMTGTSNNITINPGIAKTLKIIGPSVAVPVNALNQIDIVALDAYGNVATISGDIAITSSLPGLHISGPDITMGGNGPAISMTNGKALFYAMAGKAETDVLSYSFDGMTASESITFH